MSDALCLPVIDLSADAAPAAIDEALAVSGFLYLTGHGIDAALTARLFSTARRFFAQPEDRKDRYVYSDVEANFGFQGIGRERLDPLSMPDLKETFTMRNPLLRDARRVPWPDTEFQATALAFYTSALAAAHRLMAVLAPGLSLPPDFFTQRHQGENVTLRLLHYPANLAVCTEAQLGAGAHTDYGTLTLLVQDAVGGLEVRDAQGEWHAAPPVPDALVINAGDLLERWTNGRYRSTVHRVRPIRGPVDRYSIALFVDPDSAVPVECLPACVTPARPARYPPTTAGAHISQKIAATHRSPT